MTTQLHNLRFFSAGYCTQFGYLTGSRTVKLQRFHAVFVYFEHPIHGPCLIDTGYSEHFHKATRGLPQRAFRYLLPTRIRKSENAVHQLERAGINPQSIQRIFITHFHIDHIGGLKCFPHAKYVYRQQSYIKLSELSRIEQVENGFLSSLVPKDFAVRAEPLPAAAFAEPSPVFHGLRTFDVWNDGSLVLVDLPGHAEGHYGMMLNGVKQSIFYIVDACWNMQVLRDGRQLPKLIRKTQQNYETYLQTQKLLHFLEKKHLMLACHCPETMEYVHRSQD